MGDRHNKEHKHKSGGAQRGREIQPQERRIRHEGPHNEGKEEWVVGGHGLEDIGTLAWGLLVAGDTGAKREEVTAQAMVLQRRVGATPPWARAGGAAMQGRVCGGVVPLLVRAGTVAASAPPKGGQGRGPHH